MYRHLFTCALVLAFACQGFAEPVTIRILHLNDFHGAANPTMSPESGAQLGGAARLARKIELLRSQHPGLLLAAGDMLHGSRWAQASQGKSVIELMNMLGVQAMVPGSHDLSLGPDILRQRMTEAAFPLLAANLNGLSGPLPRIYFNRKGIRIAVIGLVGAERQEALPSGAQSTLNISATLDAARDQIAESELTADLIILLTHQGYERDYAMAQALCGTSKPETPVPILIVGGGSHTQLHHPARIGNCTVVQAWEYGKALGQVDLTMSDGKLLEVTGCLHTITATLGSGNPRVAALVRRYQDTSKPTRPPVTQKTPADRNP